MIPAPFAYEVAESVEHAADLLGSTEDGKLLAGGHSLLPAMRLRIARPSLLVDVGRLRDLAYVREDGDRIAIGALTRHAALVRDPLLRGQCVVLADAAAGIGDPQVRHRGTIGGSVAHGDPASDLPTVLLALDADFVTNARTIPAADFFTGTFSTALAADEVLTEVRVPKSSAGIYLKFHRRAQDWATVGVAAARLNGEVHVALTSMGATPLRARAVEEALRGGADAASAAAQAAEGTDPVSDTAASAEFRKHLARVLVARALAQLG